MDHIGVIVAAADAIPELVDALPGGVSEGGAGLKPRMPYAILRTTSARRETSSDGSYVRFPVITAEFFAADADQAMNAAMAFVARFNQETGGVAVEGGSILGIFVVDDHLDSSEVKSPTGAKIARYVVQFRVVQDGCY